MKRRFFLQLAGGAATLPFIQMTPLRKQEIQKHIKERTLGKITLTTGKGEVLAEFDVDENFPDTVTGGEINFTNLSTIGKTSSTAEKLRFFDKKGNFICDGDIVLNTNEINFGDSIEIFNAKLEIPDE